MELESLMHSLSLSSSELPLDTPRRLLRDHAMSYRSPVAHGEHLRREVSMARHRPLVADIDAAAQSVELNSHSLSGRTATSQTRNNHMTDLHRMPQNSHVDRIARHQKIQSESRHGLCSVQSNHTATTTSLGGVKEGSSPLTTRSPRLQRNSALSARLPRRTRRVITERTSENGCPNTRGLHGPMQVLQAHTPCNVGVITDDSSNRQNLKHVQASWFGGNLQQNDCHERTVDGGLFVSLTHASPRHYCGTGAENDEPKLDMQRPKDTKLGAFPVWPVYDEEKHQVTIVDLSQMTHRKQAPLKSSLKLKVCTIAN